MHHNGWGSETGGEEATKECGSMPWAAMLNSAGEPGEMVRSPPKLGWKLELWSSDSNLTLARQLLGQ